MPFTPTEAEIQDQIRRAIKVFEQMRLYAGVNAENFMANREALISALETEFDDEVRTAIGITRGTLSATYESGISVIAPELLEYGRFLKEPSTDLAVIFGRIYRRMIDAALRVKSRLFVPGAPTAGGGNIGNGVLNRLSIDPEGFVIENQTSDAKLVRCLVDARSGAPSGQEQFRIEGETAERDRLVLNGSGRADTLQGLTGADSANYIGNPSFSGFTGTLITALSSVRDWLPITGPITRFELTETPSEIYRTFDGEGTPRALVMLPFVDGLYQDLGLVRKPFFTPAIPMYIQVALNWTARAATGGFAIDWGSQTFSIPDVTVLPAGYSVVRIPLGIGNWYDNFNTSPLLFRVRRTGVPAGSLIIDDAITSPFVNFDGSWYAPVGGSIPWRRDDVFTFTDTETGSIIQFFMYLYFGAYLPHTTGGGVTWTDT